MHTGPRTSVAVFLAMAAIAGARAQSCNGFAGFTRVVQSAIQNLSLTGMIAQVDQHGQNVLLQTYGGYQVVAPTPLASGSKALTCAVLMTLVDQNLIHLDDPVGNYLPEWSVGPLAAVTIRHCLTHTSGIMMFSPYTTDPALTMRQAAQLLAAAPLSFVPGTAFQYGNVSMQIAGAVAEVASGTPWHQLFQQRIAGPLGMTATNYHVNGINQNPGVADSAQSSAQDYAKFLEMIRNGGLHGSTRVLSAAAVDAMLTDHTSGLPIVWTPHPLAKPYGIGFVLERRDALGRTTLASAPGAYGFFGWVDRAHDATGVWLSVTFFLFAYPYVLDAWDELDVALAPVGVTCLGTPSPICAASPPRLHATTWPRDGQPDFGIAVAEAPASAFGAVAFALGGPGPGTQLGDLVAYLPNALGSAAMVTDAAGRAVLPVPIPAGMQGLRLSLQGSWLDLGGCGQFDVVSTHALQIDVQAP